MRLDTGLAAGMPRILDGRQLTLRRSQPIPLARNRGFDMNVSAIDPTSAARDNMAAAAATQKSPARAATAAPPAPAVSVAALSTPAATVSTTSVPATVKPEDRAEYLQLLKALGGNVNAALAALAAKAAAAQAA
jgi:hypothetical protein